jgi:hypothetical protein
MLFDRPARHRGHDDARHLDNRLGFDGRNHFDGAGGVPKLR